MLLAALCESKIAVEYSVMIGDTIFDMEAAAVVNMRFIPVNAASWHTSSMRFDEINLPH
jgi:histidinol phosphatase-like enzyme